MNLDSLLALPKSGVVLLFKDKQILIAYTNSMGAHLESLYSQFSGKTGITLEIRSAGADLETLRIHTEYYRDFYTKQGFSLLQAHFRKAIKYRVRSVPSNDFKSVDVELISARGGSYVVGRFKNSRESLEFIETHYGTDNAFKFPVYSTNSATKELLMELNKKSLDII